MLVLIVIILTAVSVSPVNAVIQEKAYGQFTGTISTNDTDRRIDMTKVEVMVYEAIIDYSCTDFSGYNGYYSFSVYPNSKGVFTFNKPSENFLVMISLPTIPESFGIDKKSEFFSSKQNSGTFSLAKIADVKLDLKSIFDNPQINFFDSKGNQLYCSCNFKLSESTKESFVKMLDLKEITYSGTVDCGILFDVSTDLDISNIPTIDKVNFLYENKIITEEEKIDKYCDIVLNLDSSGGFCLTGIVEEILNYETKNNKTISQDISKKITKILTHPAEAKSIVQNNYFIVHYDSPITQGQANTVANIMSSIRTYMNFLGFNLPILQSGEAKYHVYLYNTDDPDGTAAATAVKAEPYSGNTCASYICLYNFIDNYDDLCEILSHEYFHAIQNSYNHTSGWFKEACASWCSVSLFGLANRSSLYNGVK